jgi:DNA repair exonuclease SbcCD ATPase subunit
MPKKPKVTLEQLKVLAVELLVEHGDVTNARLRERAQEKFGSQGSNGTIQETAQWATEWWESLLVRLEQQAQEGAPVVPETLQASFDRFLCLVAGTIDDVRTDGHRAADDRVEARERELARIADDLRQELSDSRDRVEQLERDSASRAADLGEAAKRISDLEEVRDGLTARLAEVDAELDTERKEAKTERIRLEAERHKVESQVADHLSELKKLRKEYVGREEDLRKELAGKDKALTREVEAAREERAQERTNRERVEAELKDQRERTEQLRQELDELRSAAQPASDAECET